MFVKKMVNYIPLFYGHYIFGQKIANDQVNIEVVISNTLFKDLLFPEMTFYLLKLRSHSSLRVCS